MVECAVAECEEEAAVRLHEPGAENQEVCVGHARALARREGVVAEPLEDAAEEWP